MPRRAGPILVYPGAHRVHEVRPEPPCAVLLDPADELAENWRRNGDQHRRRKWRKARVPCGIRAFLSTASGTSVPKHLRTSVSPVGRSRRRHRRAHLVVPQGVNGIFLVIALKSFCELVCFALVTNSRQAKSADPSARLVRSCRSGRLLQTGVLCSALHPSEEGR